MQVLAGLFLQLLIQSTLPGLRAENATAELIAEVRNLVSPDRGPDSVLPEQLNFLPEFYQHLRTEELTKDQVDLTCLACEAAITSLIDLFLVGVEPEQIEAALEGICTLFGITTKSVCHGGIYNYGPIIEFIIKNRTPRITSREVCAAVLGKGCGAWEEINNWTVEIPELKPEVETPVAPPEGTPVKKILHITDLHLDLTYTVGNNAECDLPMCCGNTSGVAPTPESAAGHWGSYNCDVPHWTFKHILEHIREVHIDELDYIMVTGDFPAHDVWLQSKDHNLATARTVMDYIKEVFPDTQVFPSLGNHEPFPCNIIPGSTAGVDATWNPDWLLSELSEYYAAWLPEEQLATFRETAAYSYLYRPGFRIISFPSPLCLTYNFFLWMDFSDPGNMLTWLVDQLFLAEEAGERVHILSHVPAGNHECLGGWGREYTRIVERFENTIVGHFHGHTHNDEFEVFYDTETKTRPTNIAYITPSIASYTGFNHGYRLYTVDAGHPDETYRILDTETFVFDLPSANAAGPDVLPNWYKIYSAREDLEMENLFPAEWDRVVHRLANEEDFYEKWLKYYNKDGPGEGGSKRSILCDLVTTSNLDRSKCDEILGPEE